MSKFDELAAAATALTTLHSADHAEPHSVNISHGSQGITWEIFLPADETRELIDSALAYGAAMTDVRYQVYRIDRYLYLKAEGTFAGLHGKVSGATQKSELLPLVGAKVTAERLRHLNDLCHSCGQHIPGTNKAEEEAAAWDRAIAEASIIEDENAEVTA